MSALTKMEKLMFPGFLFVFEVVFLVLFGFLVRYDEGGAPDTHLETAIRIAETTDDSSVYVRELASSLSTTKTYPFFQDVHVMIFVGFGFLMTFLRRYGYGSIGFNMLLASFAIQWATITTGLFTFIEQIRDVAGTCCTIFVSIESMVSSDFAAAAVLITMGAVLGRASPFQLIIIAFFELMFYSANEALNLHVYHAADVGGSMIIHTFGAYFGIAVSILLYHRKARDHPQNSTVYHSDLFAMIGTLFLWLFWPSFNGALASGNAQYRAVINTYFAMTGSVVSTFLFSMAVGKEKKINMSHVQNATLAGGVAVGAVADMVIQPWGGLLIGFLAGFISVMGYRLLSPQLERFGILDTCGVHNLHGLPGVFSGIASTLAAGLAQMEGGSGSVGYRESLYLVFPARAPGNFTGLSNAANLTVLGIEPGLGRTAGTQAGYQLALLVTTLAISITGGLITGVIVRFLPAFQPTDAKDFYDDKPYWELADDADNYLFQEDKQETPNNHTVEMTAQNLRLRAPVQSHPVHGHPAYDIDDKSPSTQTPV